ncbi:5'-methylthioadenosine nucleosidase/S-adenosylhomocysteine nucleosidase [Pigmentiphaga soli]
MVLVAAGLAFEAAIAAGDGVRVVCGQGTVLAARLQAQLGAPRRAEPGGLPCAGLVSFGTAGGLVDGLRPGDWIVARAVRHGGAVPSGRSRYQAVPCDEAWSLALLRALPRAVHADIAGVSAPVAAAAGKRALHAATGAQAADMESQIVAAAALAHGLPFVCCRVIVDPVERDLPPAALAGSRPDGSVDLPAVLRSLLRNPKQLPALLAVARDANRARQALKAGRRAIGQGFDGMAGS